MFKDLALPLIAEGIKVIPVQPLGKRTYLKGGPERGTLDPKQIETWDKENPAYNCGILGTLDGCCIFDCDQKGLVSQIEKETGQKMPRTFTVKSANKGAAHLVFRQTDRSRALGNKTHRAGELRGDNEYTVGPGSTIICDDGAQRTYELFRDNPPAPFPDFLADWILANLGAKKDAATGEVDQDAYTRLRKAYLLSLNPENMFGLPDLTITSLHPTLVSLAGLLHDGERSEEDVCGILERVALEYGHREPRGPKEIEGIVSHVFTKTPVDFELFDLPPSWTDGLKVFGTEAELVESKKIYALSWESLFHTYYETMHAPPLSFAIDHFLQEAGVTMLGALPGHGKTLVALEMVKSMLEGGALFGHFAVPKLSSKVLYLIPESGLAPFVARLKLARLTDHIRDKKLFYRTLSKDNQILALDDPRLREACEGADVFLDTAVRFMDGDENAASEQRIFAQNLFTLLRCNARTVTGLHHSPKAFQKAEYMSLENVLRGSGDIGAMICACWGLYLTDKAKTQIWVENVKARDFLPCDPLVIEGRPYLGLTGSFKMVDCPGVAGLLVDRKPARGRPETPEKEQKMPKILELHGAGKSTREIATEVGVPQKTVSNWLGEEDRKSSVIIKS